MKKLTWLLAALLVAALVATGLALVVAAQADLLETLTAVPIPQWVPGADIPAGSEPSQAHAFAGRLGRTADGLAALLGALSLGLAAATAIGFRASRPLSN